MVRGLGDGLVMIQESKRCIWNILEVTRQNIAQKIPPRISSDPSYQGSQDTMLGVICQTF